MEKEIKQGDMVVCKLVTGEKAVGTFECQKPTTGSYLIKNITTENGLTAEYGWAEIIEPKID